MFELAWPIPTPALLAAVAAPVDDAVGRRGTVGPAVAVGGAGGSAVATDGEERQEQLGVAAIGVAVGVLIGVVVLPGVVDREVVAGVRPCLLEDPDVGVGILVDVIIDVCVIG